MAGHLLHRQAVQRTAFSCTVWRSKVPRFYVASLAARRACRAATDAVTAFCRVVFDDTAAVCAASYASMTSTGQATTCGPSLIGGGRMPAATHRHNVPVLTGHRPGRVFVLDSSRGRMKRVCMGTGFPFQKFEHQSHDSTMHGSSVGWRSRRTSPSGSMHRTSSSSLPMR